jgi:hypothetical protein
MATEPITREIAGTCVNEFGSAIGMPQLCIDWFGNQIFWLIVALVAIYFILSRVALPRIGAVLAERQGTITNDIAAAEDLKVKATEAEAAYDKALIDARAEAQQIIAAAKADIQADLDTARSPQNPPSPKKRSVKSAPPRWRTLKLSPKTQPRQSSPPSVALLTRKQFPRPSMPG